MSSREMLSVTNSDAISKVVALLQQAGVTAFQAAALGVIALITAERGGRVSIRHLRTFKRPVLVLIGDDDHASSGPSGWPNVQRLLRWSAGVIVHAGPGHPEHYAAAVEDAVTFRQVVFVETSAEYANVWLKAVPPGRRTHLLVPANGVHPVLSREQVQ